MGKFIDLTGQKFGRLTVIERAENRGKQTYWLCKCECGNEVIVRGGSLKNGTTKSCGCLNSEKSAEKGKKNVIDLTGMKFGRLTVIERTEKPVHVKSNEAYWICQCECGNITKPIASSDLKKGGIVSCGCWRKELRLVDLTGMKFGRLTVIKPVGSECKKILWLCECECGNMVKVYTSHLMNGNTKSCGCLQKEKARERLMKNKNPNFKGGITPITQYLRALNEEWSNNCKKQADYTCQLTGKRGANLHTHHLYCFSFIVKDAHKKYNIEIKPQVKEYSQEELKLLEDYIKECHKDNSNAVVLCDEIHYLFHKEYGFYDNTPEQFEEFKERYLAGEFDNSDSNNNKVA